jgi:DNA-binding winged helix-turn-helix (wHTH) protein
MPDLAEPVICRFDNFLLDRQARTLCQLHSDGRATPILIGSRALQILCLLVDRRGEIVSQSEIMDVVWANVAVEPNNLSVQVSALRRVLDANRSQGSCIRNVAGRGYLFVPTVTEQWPRSLDQVEGTLPEEDRQGAGEGAARDDTDTRPAPGTSHAAAQSTLAAIELHDSVRRRRRYTACTATCLCIAALLLATIWYADRTA